MNSDLDRDRERVYGDSVPGLPDNVCHEFRFVYEAGTIALLHRPPTCQIVCI